jgi:hypothetical protein
MHQRKVQGGAAGGDPYCREAERDDALGLPQFSGVSYFFRALARFRITRNFTILATNA